MEENRLILGRQLRDARRKNDWTLAQVAHRAGLAISTVSKVERGQMVLSYDRFVRLVTSLGLDIKDLVSGYVLTAMQEKVAVEASNLCSPRAEDPPDLSTEDPVSPPKVIRQRLFADIKGKRMQPLCLEVTKDQSLTSERQQNGEALIYVLFGRVRVTFQWC